MSVEKTAAKVKPLGERESLQAFRKEGEIFLHCGIQMRVSRIDRSLEGGPEFPYSRHFIVAHYCDLEGRIQEMIFYPADLTCLEKENEQG